MKYYLPNFLYEYVIYISTVVTTKIIPNTAVSKDVYNIRTILKGRIYKRLKSEGQKKVNLGFYQQS